MAKASLHQKVHLLVDFLLGMRLPEPHALLVQRGWSVDKMDHGWRLVEQAGRARFSAERFTTDRANAQLLEFKKRWFSVVRITLGKRVPRIAAALLGSYDDRSQGSASFLIAPFLSTLDELERSADADERAARELLRERGLTAEVVTAAAQLIEQSRQLVATKPPVSCLEAEAQAEEELWEFYLEWSGLARRTITNRNLLRSLGLNKAGRPSAASQKRQARGQAAQKIGNARLERPTTVLVEAITPAPSAKIFKERN